MSIGKKWAAFSQTPGVRALLVGLGFLLIALTPLVGPIPGPGVLKYSGWAKRLYVRLKRKHPNKGAWADWSLRRASARRRQALMRERQAAEEAAGFTAGSVPEPSVGESAAERAK